MDIKKNLEEVLNNIELAEKRSITGEKVKLIAVTKTHGIDIIEKAIELGVKDIGENKVQELTKKMEVLKDKVNYHMIGNLQSNKVKFIYNKVKLIHSLDRLSLAKEIEKRAGEDNIKVNCLIQINIGDESTKGGIELRDTEKFVESLLEFEHIKIMGLMAIAPNTDDEKLLRTCFKNMFNMKEKIKSKGYKGLEMKYLSMGMSNDYEIAIEEGANMVRVGSKIFGVRNYNI